MKLKELKEKLNKLPSSMDDVQVIMSSDSEGNNYSPLAVVDTNIMYVPETTWSGTIYDPRWSADDACMEKDEWKELKANKKNRAILLCPTN